MREVIKEGEAIDRARGMQFSRDNVHVRRTDKRSTRKGWSH